MANSRVIPGVIRSFLFVGLLAFSGTQSGVGATLDLSGEARFRVGDNSRWAKPEWNDADWESVSVPGSLQQESSTYGLWKVGWYRLRFEVPLDFDESNAALYLGVVGNAEEVFINGFFVGGQGKVSVLGAPTPRLERVYGVDESLLRKGDENVMAMRVWTSFGKGGIAKGPVLLGDYHTLLNRAFQGEKPARTIEIVTLSAVAIFFLGSLLLASRLPLRSAMSALVFVLGVIFAMRFLSSFYVYERGWFTHRAFVWVLVGYFVSFPLTVYFTSRLLDYSLPIGFWRVAFWLNLVLAFSLHLPILWQLPQDHPTMIVVTLAWLGVSLYFIILLARMLLQTLRNKKWEWISVFIGLLGMLFAYVSSTTNLSSAFPPWMDEYVIDDLMLILFLLGISTAAILQHQRVILRVSALSDRVLSAHEEERARLSRELHDGVAQSLQALRLKAKIIRSQGAEETDALLDQIGGLTDGIGQTLEELRTVSRDLRPATLERMPLDDALRWYAHEIDLQTGVAVMVTSSLDSELPKRTTEHLYRICQEAIINALRHGQASEIRIVLVREASAISVVVSDNGEGFAATSQTDPQDHGIGLVNMTDRAQLLGGTCEVKSVQNEGTTVTIMVPIDAR